VKLMIRVKS